MSFLSINYLKSVWKLDKYDYADKLSSSSLASKNTPRNWQPIPDVFYLLDTIKIRFETEVGKITLEDINLNDLEGCLDYVKQTSFPDFEKHFSPIFVTVCGVTWECSDEQKRIRAIPKVAGIRYFYGDQRDSDAYFYHPEKIRLDCSPNDYFSERLSSEVSVSSNITVDDFINRLLNNNQKFLEQYGQKLQLRKENFDSPLSRHERDVINRIC